MARTVKQGKGKAAAQSDDGEAEFEVEKIKGHKRVRGGGYKYLVKWQNYDDIWNTWEPESNVHADELLKEYWTQQKASGRKSAGVASETPQPELKPVASSSKGKRRASSASHPNKRAKREPGTETSIKEDEDLMDQSEHHAKFTDSADAYEQEEDWEDLVIEISTVEKTSDGQLVAYCVMSGGEMVKVDTSFCNARCPQKMLKFYESHLKWNNIENGENGE